MRFRSLALALSVLTLLGASEASGQQAWPVKPIHFIVAYAAGGFADIRARMIGVELAKTLGQPLIIENKPGAGGVLGTDAVAKAAPDGYTIGMGNLAALAVNPSQMAGIDITHVAYKGGAPAATDLLAGHVQMMFEMGYAALPSIRAGKIRALAVTSTKRLSVLPELPTMAEAGVVGFESYNWQGVIVPAGTPREIVERLNRELNKILARPLTRELIASTGSEIGGGTPEAFGAFIRSETEKWGKVVKQAGIRAE